MTEEIPRLSRLVAILTHLQAQKTVTGKELADKFDVSLRTIYRDMNALQDAGVPIASEQGVGYSIVHGYHLPPIMLTEEEAQALIVSEKLILNQGDSSLIQEFQSLLIKIRSVLRHSQQEAMEILDDRIAPATPKQSPPSAWLTSIQKAISQSEILKIIYQSIYKEEVTSRNVEPLAVYFTEKAWVLIAYCQLRKSVREFRLDRIRHLWGSGEHFKHREFDLRKYFHEHSEY